MGQPRYTSKRWIAHLYEMTPRMMLSACNARWIARDVAEMLLADAKLNPSRARRCRTCERTRLAEMNPDAL